MYISEIKKLFKDIMYINDSTDINVEKSLFLDYGMTSIDFIDFSFELKKKFNVDIDPNDLWPINKMATFEENYSFQDKQWTPVGLVRLNEQLIFSGKDKISNPEIEFKELYNYFTLSYINAKLASFIHSEK
ncbi:acyl carrier protein [Photorhabdus laumondii]|uniref:acyl carrier protein n=1 Tax=Photorhabdus laumondii TaxID=2218628 RepID=UPI00331577B3